MAENTDGERRPGLAADIAARQAYDPRKGCAVGKALVNMDEGDAADLLDALNDPVVRGETIAHVLTERGYRMKGLTVQNHRKEICGCTR